jgi:hypothetical protein
MDIKGGQTERETVEQNNEDRQTDGRMDRQPKNI